MSRPLIVMFSSPGRKPSNPIRPPNCTGPSPMRAVISSRRMPRGSNRMMPLMPSSALGIDRWRTRPFDHRRAAGKHRRVERAVDRRRELGAARSEHVAGEPLQDAEVRVARRLQRDPAIAQAHASAEPQARVLAHQLQVLHVHVELVERDPDGRRVLQRVVEQPQVDRVHRGVRQQVVEVRQFPDDANRPLATAVVNGESRGSNSRTYGSSELSWNRNVSSASACGVSATRPVPVIASRGDAASRSPLSSLPRSVSEPLTCPTPSSPTNRSFTRILKSFRGMSNVPLPWAVNSARPDSGALGNRSSERRSTESAGRRR